MVFWDRAHKPTHLEDNLENTEEQRPKLELVSSKNGKKMHINGMHEQNVQTIKKTSAGLDDLIEEMGRIEEEATSIATGNCGDETQDENGRPEER